MSFVLEALKRSEHQRQVSAVPNLGSYVLPSRRAMEGKPTAWIIAGVVLLVVTALAGWWMGNRRPPATISPAPPEPVSIPASAPMPAPATDASGLMAAAVPVQTAPAARPQPTRPALVSEPVAIRSPLPAVAAKEAPRSLSTTPLAPQAAPPVQPTVQSQTVPSTRPAAPLSVALPSLNKLKPQPNPPAASEDSVPVGYGELPATVRQALPDMKISGYMIGNDGRGLVGINDRLMAEGEEVSPGLVVEKIDPDGVVFRFRQYRFRR